MSVGAIAVATSIMPTLSRRNAGRILDSGYQKLCIRSWLDCGFRIVSVNHPDEIPALAASYPEVSFVAAEGNGQSSSGRRPPTISDLLKALLEAPEPVIGIINSDLVFEPSAAWQTWLPRVVGDALVTGQRHDATSLLDGTFRKYYWGFDFFFFDIKAARDLLETATPFAMGLAWWDYWLPAALSLKGRQVLTLERPTVAHLIHKEPHLDDSWRQLAVSFANFVVQEATKVRGPLPPSVSAVLPLCRELTQVPELRWRNRGADTQISQIAVQYIPAITRNIANVPVDGGHATASSPHGIVPANVFHRFAERLSAGEALERAKRLEREGRIAEARSGFQDALEKTPHDFDLLYAIGEFRLRQGDSAGAVDLLRRASEREPDDRSAFCTLASALHQAGQRAEAASLLEGALAKWPDFSEAHNLLARFSQDV